MPTGLPVFQIIFGGPIGICLGGILLFLGGLCLGFALGRYHAKWGGGL